jgi:hypothetical protein
MKPEHKAVLKTAGTFGAIGAGALLVLGNPVAWAALGYATYKVGKSAYLKEQERVKLQRSGQDPDLFI